MPPIKTGIRIWAFILFILLASTLVCAAEVKEVVVEYTYQMGSGETRADAEKNALKEAKRLAIEQAGTYLETYSEVVNQQLTKDEIHALAAGIMQTTVLETKALVEADTFKLYIRIKAIVDTANLIGKMNDRQFIDENKRLHEANTKLLQELEETKRKLLTTQDELVKKHIQSEITQTQSKLRANDWYEEGKKAYNEKNYDIAIAAFSKAIALNPQFAKAYTYRGLSYDYKRMFDHAISDYDKALQISPQEALIYNNRGNSYANKGQLDKALADYNVALQIDPRYASAYHNRGIIYHEKGVLDLAIVDFDIAISLSPNDVEAYYSRANAYFDKNKFDKAIADYDKALQINPKHAKSYFDKGIACMKIGLKSEAIEAFRNFINFAPSEYSSYIEKAKKVIQQLEN